jgi:sodium-dependent phosphate cotransporter
VGSFSLFDKALPDVNPQQGRFRRIADIVYRPKVMFTLGAAVTCLTMSVSVSLGILVPISAKGYVRRENLIPYIMGANVSTFIDTIFAAILVGEPRALGVVLAQMLSVGFLSTLMLFSLFYRRYRDGLERLLEFVTQSRIHFMVFLMITMLMPFLWLLL